MAVGARNPQTADQGPVTIWPMNQEAVTPSDSTQFDAPTAITVYGAGDIRYEPYGAAPGAFITITVSAAMVPFSPRCMVRRVRATGTTATLIYGSW